MQTPKKGTVKKTTITKNTPNSKENITTKNSKGTTTYNADKKGNVSSSAMDKNKNIKFTTSMDTTGYAAGKPYYTHTISTKSGTQTATVPRKQVPTRIKNMKEEAKAGLKKKGGIVKSKRK